MRVHPPATDRLSPTSSAASALPPDENQQSVRTESDQLAQLAAYERSRKQSVSSSHSCESMDDNKTRRLWRCMLDLQERYGCYNSTRINMALDAGDEAIGLMPNRFIIDTLNDSIVDLPEEGWDALKHHLDHLSSK